MTPRQSVKREFKVGDRIRVFGGFRCIAGPGNWTDAYDGVTGEVVRVGPHAEYLHFKSDDDGCVHSIHPRQCVRLKPRRKTREWWMAIYQSGVVAQILEGSGPDNDPPNMLPPCSNQDLPTWIKVREVLLKKARGE